ncbi:haloacid dehalogenase type II [Ahrensia sp. R2A130]|uniref:haloacid dehalogenase type II n=1 Tax=Ahrensia sp. R2A130 TaxID=744979 RepID=UPI0001E0F09D|nr:haloacid dehalogenase type II [Ahrensia sp. R2A130]EFL89900.1 haloacid dehalogenase, type II [Ahrensia sp. R2A130]
MTAPKAYIFDVFGTLVDWRSGIADAAREAGLDVDHHKFADHWRGLYQQVMEPVRSGARPYTPIDILHRENLEATLDHFGITGLDDETKTHLNAGWERLPAWQDAPTGLEHLHEHGILGTCSNGSIALMSRLARYAGLPFDCILGADIARSFKPKLEVYHASCAALRLDPADVMMVAAHNSDLVAAREAGLQTAFIARPTEHGEDQTIDLEPNSDWHRVVSTIGELASR